MIELYYKDYLQIKNVIGFREVNDKNHHFVVLKNKIIILAEIEEIPESVFKKLIFTTKSSIEDIALVHPGKNFKVIFSLTSDYIFTVSQLKSKILSALMYPAVIILFSFVSVLIATNVVVPKIASVLAGFGKELPVITKIVIIFSKLFVYMLFLIPVFVILFVLRDRFLNRAIQPLTMLAVGVVIGLIIISVILPITELSTVIKK